MGDWRRIRIHHESHGDTVHERERLVFAGIEGAGLVVFQEPLLKECSVVCCCWEGQLGGFRRGLPSSWASTGCMLRVFWWRCYRGGMLCDAGGFVLLVHFPHGGEVLGDHT